MTRKRKKIENFQFTFAKQSFSIQHQNGISPFFKSKTFLFILTRLYFGNKNEKKLVEMHSLFEKCELVNNILNVIKLSE